MRLCALGMTLALAGCIGDWSLTVQDAGDGEELGEEAGVEAIEPRGSASDPEADRANSTGTGSSADDDAAGDPEEPNIATDAGGRSELDGAADGAVEDANADRGGVAQKAAVAIVETTCDTPLALACSAHNVAQKLACVRRVWAFNGSCDGATRCDTRSGVTQGTCQAITSRCLSKQPGDHVCDGAERKRCGADLLDEVPAPCNAHEHCAGAGLCVCDPGFAKGPGDSCEDIVDCPTSACSNGACTDGTGTYRCSCNRGFQPSSDGKACVNVDDCTPGVCGVGGSCVDGVNDYQCSCASGYEQSLDKKRCTNIDNCVGNPCSPGMCIDGVNAYRCQCAPPYIEISFDGTTFGCINECDLACCGGCGGW